MSEYQYYEFLALDRPLDQAELAQVRALSTRARITATSFTNTYHWGNFRGDPHRLVERYYDAHLYVTNWGTHQVMFRLPRAVLDAKTVEPYLLDDERTNAWATKTHLILDLRSNDDSGDWVEDAEESLHTMVGVRAELASGDFRALYLAWLAALSRWADEDDDEEGFRSVVEPPVPAGLAKLTAPQHALADFLRVDADLLAVAAEASAPSAASPRPMTKRQLAPLVAALPADEKNDLLVRLALGQEPGLPAELRRRLLPPTAPATTAGQRSAAQLLDAAYARGEERRQHAARQAAEAAARHEAAETAKRERRLTTLAGQGEGAWKRADDLIAAKKAVDFDLAVALLEDLHEISTRAGQAKEFRARLRGLREQHQRKAAFIRRLDSSDVLGGA